MLNMNIRVLRNRREVVAKRSDMVFTKTGMFRARPRCAVLASGLAVPDRAGPAQPLTLHFYRELGAWPGPLARPLTSISQTPRFYQPGQATPRPTVSDRVGPCRDRVGPCRASPGRVAVSA